MTECGLTDSGYPQKIKRKKCSNVLVTSSDDKGKGGGAGGGEPRKHLSSPSLVRGELYRVSCFELLKKMAPQ